MPLKTPKSPLTYPNDKPRAASLVASLIPNDTESLFFPFLGGGSLELAMAHRGYQVKASTDFRLLYDFWNCIMRDPERVYMMANGFHPIQDSKIFYMLQKKVYQPHDEFLRSALFYVLTLCASASLATSGRLEPGTPRFSPLRLMQLSKFECENLVVEYENYHKAIAASDEYMVCVPPPYIAGNFSKAVIIPENPQIDHNELAALMTEKKDWLVLYNYHENLRKLYPENEMILLDSASRPTTKHEDAVEVIIIGS